MFVADGACFAACADGGKLQILAMDVDGAELTPGTTICLLEVMKTFHRVTYGGPGLPDTARVRRVLVADGDDVNAGDPLLALA